MLLRALVLLAVAVPLCAQDSDDVTKYLDEIRANRPAPRDPKAAQEELLAVVTKQLEGTADPAEKAALYQRVAEIERSLGHANAAIAAARAARSLQPNSKPIALALADVLVENGLIGEVPALLAVDPTDGQALLHKADELAQSHLGVAVHCAELAHQFLPDDLSVTDTLGMLYLWQGNSTQAGTAFLQAIVAVPHVATYHYHLALSMLQRGLRDDARTELLTALDCNPRDDERAALQAALGRLDPPK